VLLYKWLVGAKTTFDAKSRMLDLERSLQLQFQGTSPLLCYLLPRLSLPTPAQTDVGDCTCATASANAEVARELDKGKENSRKRRLIQLLRTRTGHR